MGVVGDFLPPEGRNSPTTPTPGPPPYLHLWGGVRGGGSPPGVGVVGELPFPTRAKRRAQLDQTGDFAIVWWGRMSSGIVRLNYQSTTQRLLDAFDLEPDWGTTREALQVGAGVPRRIKLLLAGAYFQHRASTREAPGATRGSRGDPGRA